MNKSKRYREAQRGYQQQIVMKDASEFSKIYLVPFADWHIGSANVALNVIQGYIDWIKQRDNAFTFLNGDMMNCATKDTAPELFEDLTTPDVAYEELFALLKPIKSKILMITRGGHEEAIFRKVGHDYMAQLARDLDVPYKPDGGMVGIRLTKNKHARLFSVYGTHGWGGARTIGAKVKKPEDISLGIEADCIVVSHDHTMAVHRLNVLHPPHSRLSMTRPVYLKVRRVLLVNTGGFLYTAGYVQRKGYIPQDLGTPRIRFEIKNVSKGDEGYMKDLHCSI